LKLKKNIFTVFLGAIIDFHRRFKWRINCKNECEKIFCILKVMADLLSFGGHLGVYRRLLYIGKSKAKERLKKYVKPQKICQIYCSERPS
jgi:hypothetical protein